MKRRYLSLINTVAPLCLAALTASGATQPSRQVLSLDGIWKIAEGGMDHAPTVFDRTVPVPGLVSLAAPAFTDPPGPKVAERSRVPQKDPKRDAFWYRRIFLFEQSTPAVAVLKVHKAMFGTRVMLNGQILGDHLPSFTPGYFNATSALKVGENELLIRVGADRNAVGPAIPSGFDFEKERYLPGIFDSVELILSGTPNFTHVQTVPDIAAKTVRVQATLRNEAEPTQATVSFVVHEAKSGRLSGHLSTTSSLAKNAESTVDVRIPIEDCRLWSPEDPFLYTVEADCGTDRFETRFGMREFKFDPGTGRAMLNGQPYFMRGSNFTLYRFFEDSECKDLPWRRDWVRLLHQRVKEMHWNCLRYCIGFPPESWYDVADEVGILIQDEFPIWSLTKETKREELTTEYAEWMRERWNHPCVVIWDANNETRSSETGPAIRQVRGLDLSNRPWDNSYNPPQEPGDVFESHPYHFNPSFRLANLATADHVPQGNPTRNDGKHAVIINEYGWHWLNRDGTPTTLTRDIYRSVLGENATTAQRFHMQATWLAADTEFWRAHRQAAAVVHFTMLGYSRPDGQTCDHWRNVEKLEWEPEFYRYVRDAFAPVGLAVNFWPDRVIHQTQARVPVILINDLDQPWSGSVRLKLRSANAATMCFDAIKQAHLEPFGQATLDFDLTWPDALGAYALEAELRGADGQSVRSDRELEIIDARSLGLAYLKAATASSVHSTAYAPANAVDGDTATYWSSTFADPAWLEVDLGEVRKISRVHITWENAYSQVFAVQWSRDGQNWTDAYREDNGRGGVSEILFTPVEARHVRILGIKRGTQWGHAIREFQIFE